MRNMHAQRGRSGRVCSITRALHAGDAVSGQKADAQTGQLLRQVRAQLLVKATQDLRSTQHHGDFAAQQPQHARQFQRDVARALHHHAAGLLRQFKKSVGVDGQFLAGYWWPRVGPAAGGHQDGVSRQGAAIGQAHRVGVLQHRAGIEQGDARLEQVAAVDGL